MIEAAAILKNEKIWTLPKPNRHSDIISHMNYKLGPEAQPHGKQGFVDDQGNFLDRRAAAYHALKCGQILAPRWPPNLFSEDLW